MLSLLLLFPLTLTAKTQETHDKYSDTVALAVNAPISPPEAPRFNLNNIDDRYDLMSYIGIPESDFDSVDFIVSSESGWHPDIVNKNSGSCGLMQALPCSKVGKDWRNPVVALTWMDGYVKKSYGGWKQAKLFWMAYHWY